MEGIQLFKSEAKLIQAHFPDLFYSEDEEGVPCVQGKLVLLDKHGAYIDHYEIRIVPTKFYPTRFPHVFEIGGRIPINFDWHVFEQDGHCCIKSLPEEILICKSRINLLTFIQDEVIPYFFNQKFRDIHGYFLKERSHGDEGPIEFFKEKFKTKNLGIILKGLALIREQKLPNRVAKCFCNSGLKYRNCHREALKELSKFNNIELDHFGEMLLKAIASNKQ